jgi:hypothetical protein
MSGYLPADVANQALDAAGVDHTIGDLEEGTRPAQVILRAYPQVMRQLLRSAHWDWARKTAPLVLLGDATGQTPNVGTTVPIPWTYCYAYPIDCMKVRFIPWNYYQYPAVPTGNIAIPQDVPLTTGFNAAPLTGQRLIPSRFVIATDPNYTPPPGQIVFDTPGESPIGRTVILSNVQNAQCVYTAFIQYPTVWDPLFRQALVAMLAQQVALPLAKDKKFGMQMRRDNIEIAKGAIRAARVTDGNEGTPSSDIAVDWMRIRNTGGRDGYQGRWNDGPGNLYGGWDTLMLADGSTF